MLGGGALGEERICAGEVECGGICARKVNEMGLKDLMLG